MHNTGMRSGRFIIISSLLCIAAMLYQALGILSFSKNNTPVRSDAAVVLGAASWGDRPSLVFKERIDHALWLHANGYVKKIIFTGARDSGNEPPASAVARRYAIGYGIREKDILTEDRSRTTEENLRYASKIAAENDLKTILIVSDPLHMKRAMLIAHDLKMRALQAPTPTTRYRSLGSKSLFLARELFFYLTYCVKRHVYRIF